MKKISHNLAFFVVLSLLITSCVDRKTNEEEGTVRLEAPQENTADTEYTEAIQESDENGNSEMSNEDMVEIAEAKSVINDYYDAFTRKAPREAFDMWKPKAQGMDFSKFSEENPNYEKISVTFDDNSTTEQQVQTSGNTKTVTLPVRISATDSDGNIYSYSGTAMMEKNTEEDNAEYLITSLDTTQEDS